MRERNIQEEGRLAIGVAAHEIDRFVGQFTVNQTSLGKVVFRNIFGGLTHKSFHHLGYVDNALVEAR